MSKVKKKDTKPRPDNYEPKLAIKGTFAETIKVALNKQDEVKKARNETDKK